MIIRPSELKNKDENIFVTNSEDLIQVQKNNFTKIRRSRLEKVLIVVLLLLVVLLVAIGVFAAVTHYKYMISVREKFCKTIECVQAANDILLSMNQTVNPCQDFYQFACGNYHNFKLRKDEEMRKDWFSFVEEQFHHTITETINNISSNDERTSSGKLKLLIQSCLQIENQEIPDMNPIFELLRNLSLPITIPDNATAKAFNIMEVSAQIYRLLDFHIFIDITFAKIEGYNTVVLNNPKPRFLLRGIVPPYEDLARARLSNKEILSSSLTYIFNVLYIFEQSSKKDSQVTIKDTQATAMKILLFMSNFNHFLIQYQKSSEPGTLQMDVFQQFFMSNTNNKINLEQYLESLTQDVTEDIKFNKVFIVNKAFISNFPEFFMSLQDVSIQRYMWFRVVEHLLMYFGPAFYKIKEEFHNQQYYGSTKSSWKTICIKNAKNLVPFWIAYELRIQQEKHQKTFNSVALMMDDIQKSFRTIVNTAPWLDEKSKSSTLEKLDSVKTLFGYPNWITKPGKIDKVYKEVHLTKGRYLRNVVSIISYKVRHLLNSLINENVQTTNPIWYVSSIFDSNAFYSSRVNSIVIPIGILQPPFYGREHGALNYGGVGFILGHELTHGFDTHGSNIGKDGTYNKIWNNEVLAKFHKKKNCFVRQYNQYYFQNIKVDGLKTIDENIADNGGIRESFWAYRRYLKRHGPEKKLPGLEQYSSEQLFYLAFANAWCNNVNPKLVPSLMSSDHTVSKFRIIGTLSNSKEFSETWSCPENSPMNPSNKCVIW